MKKQLLTLLALLPLLAFGQSFKEDPNFVPDPEAPKAKRYFIDTVATSINKKEQLYSIVLSYLSKSVNDSRNVIEDKNLELGEVSFSVNMKTSVVKSDTTKKGKISSYVVRPTLFFKCNVYVKDNKFKIVMSKIKAEQTGLLNMGMDFYPFDKSAYFAKEHTALFDLAISFVKSLSEAMNRKPENEF